MKFLADENIPLEVVIRLRRMGIDIQSLSELNPGVRDEEVLSISNKEKRILITFDTDFGKLVFKYKKKSYGIILLRLDNHDIDYIISILKKVFPMNINFKESFCVIEENRIRVIPL